MVFVARSVVNYLFQYTYLNVCMYTEAVDQDPTLLEVSVKTALIHRNSNEGILQSTDNY